MNRILNLTKPPVDKDALVVSVADLKLYLQLEGTANDTTLASYIKAATVLVEEHLNKSIRPLAVSAKFEQRDQFKPWPLPYPPIAEVVSAKWQECPAKWVDMEPPYDYTITIEEGNDGQFYGYMGRGQMQFPTYRLVYTTAAIEDDSALEAVKVQAGWYWTHRDDPTVTGISPIALSLIQSIKGGTF